MLVKMKENGDLYITLFSENGDTHFPMKIFQMCYTDFSSHIDRQLRNLTEAQRVWVYIYTAQGSSGILNYWIFAGMKESPEEVAGFIEHLISNTMRNS